MGVVLGEKICIVNVLRILVRYVNLDIVEDIYGINLLFLVIFVIEMYKDDFCKEFILKVND